MATGNNPFKTGRLLTKAGISADKITSNALQKLPQPISKGLLYELGVFRKNYGYSWSGFYNWVRVLHGDDDCLPSLSSVKATISRIEAKCSTLSRNKHPDQIDVLFKEPAFSSTMKPVVSKQGKVMQHFPNDENALKETNTALARELKNTEIALESECHKTEELTHKLSKLSVRNTNKKLKRRDQNLKDYKFQLDAIQEACKVKEKEVVQLTRHFECKDLACERNRVANFRSSQKVLALTEETNEVISESATLSDQFERKIDELETN